MKHSRLSRTVSTNIQINMYVEQQSIGPFYIPQKYKTVPIGPYSTARKIVLYHHYYVKNKYFNIYYVNFL